MAGNPFGLLLRTLRTRHGLSQAQLGHGACTRAHVSAIEAGLRAPSGFVIRHFLARLPERRPLVEALVASYPPRPDWILPGIALALWGEKEAARMIFATLAEAGKDDPSFRSSGHGARSLGWRRYLEGRFEEALELLRAGVERHRRAGQFWEAAWGLWELGLIVAEEAPTPEAIRCFREARRVWGRRGGRQDQRFHAILLHSEARALQRLGCFQKARARAEEAARLYQAAGDRLGEGHAFLEAAHAAHETGALDHCRLLADEARERLLASKHETCLGLAELAAAIALIDQGLCRAREAASRLRAAEALLALGAGDQLTCVLAEQARLALLQGDRARAQGLIEQALEQHAPALERAQQLCLAAAIGLQSWPETRQAVLRLSQTFRSPWEKQAYLRATARHCARLQQWQWAVELYHAGERLWESCWDPAVPEGSAPPSGMSR
ncbi:MAG TPA: helix-turn-helix transcriptional regulator [Limnochorda sp.]